MWIAQRINDHAGTAPNIDKQRLLGYAGTVGKGKMREVNTALEISIGIKDLLPDNKRKRGSNYGKSEHREEKHQADPDDH